MLEPGVVRSTSKVDAKLLSTADARSVLINELGLAQSDKNLHICTVARMNHVRRYDEGCSYRGEGIVVVVHADEVSPGYC